MDSNGNWLWAKKAGGSGSGDCGKAISIDPEGNVYVIGYFENTASFGSFNITSNGSSDIFVAKIDSNGNWLWAEKAGGNLYDEIESISIDLEGNVYTIGNFSGTANFDPIQISNNGANYDFFVAKMNSDGNWLWVQSAGGNNTDSGFGICTDATGNSYVAGRFEDTANFGLFNLISNGGDDVFIANLDSAGNWIWVESAGGNSTDIAQAISLDTNGNTYVTGYFTDEINFGSFNVISNGGEKDVFVAKLEKDFIPSFTYSNNFGYSTLEVNFIDETQIAPTGWNWDFQNDGTIDSYEQNPTFNYMSPGIFDVKLIVERGLISETLIKENLIIVQVSQLLPPQNPLITVSDADIILNWDAVTNANHYLIYSSDNPYVEFEFLDYTTIETTYINSGIISEKDKYYYFVIGFDGTMEELSRFIHNNQRKSFKVEVK